MARFNGAVGQLVTFLHFMDGAGTVLDKGTITRIEARSGDRLDVIHIQGRNGENYSVQGTTDYVGVDK